MPILNNLTVNEIVGSPAGLYREFQLDASGVLIPNKTTTHIMDFTGMTDVSSYALYQAYQDNAAISGAVDMSDLTTIGGAYACYQMFQYCTGLTSANLSALTAVSQTYACYQMFDGCTGLTSFDLSALTTLNHTYACNQMFRGCTGLTSAALPALTTVSHNYACSQMFADCTGLISADLSALTTVTGSSVFGGMFQGCTSLATVYIGGTTEIDFGTRINQFAVMFGGLTQDIDVYAPAANQAKIETLTGYPNFGCEGTVTWHWRS